MIKFQQSQALTSHSESFWSIVRMNLKVSVVKAWVYEIPLEVENSLQATPKNTS